MIKLPFGIEIDNLINDLRSLSWEASDILLYYSKLISNKSSSKEIIKSKLDGEPVTAADLKVNEHILKGIQNNYKNVDWGFLSEENNKIELNNKLSDDKWIWVIDPLDGTKDFIQGTGNYSMHLALNYQNRPILGVVLIPEKNELWIAYDKHIWCENRAGDKKNINNSQEKELRDMTLVTSKNHKNEYLNKLIGKINFKKTISMGSIGCKISSILRGDSDIYISYSSTSGSSPKDWDFAAPEALLEIGGGKITDIDNKELTYNKAGFKQSGLIIASNNKSNHEKICIRIKKIIEDNLL